MAETPPDKGKCSGRERLVEAAKTLLQSRTFDEITVDEITKTADLSRPAFYYHFARGKEELREELVRDGYLSNTLTPDIRQAIIEAALRVFARSGMAGATLDEIAAEAGVSRGAICWHYRSKEDLLTAVIEQNTAYSGLRSIIEQLERELQDTKPIDDEAILHRIAGGFYDAFTAQGNLTRLSILLVHTHPEAARILAQKILKGRRVITEYVRSRQEQGLFRTNIDPSLFVQLLVMPFTMRGISQEFSDMLPFAHLSREEVINQIVSTLLYGIIQRPPNA